MKRFPQRRQDEMEKVMNQMIVQTANNEIIHKPDAKYYRKQGNVLREIRQVVKNYFSLVDSIDILIESKERKETKHECIIDPVKATGKTYSGSKPKKV